MDIQKEIINEFGIFLYDNYSDRERLSAGTIICETIINDLVRNIGEEVDDRIHLNIQKIHSKSKTINLKKYNYYRDQSILDFLYKIKNTRNQNQHAINGKNQSRSYFIGYENKDKPFEDGYLIKNLYKLIVDYFSNHTKIIIPDDLIEYDLLKPVKLYQFLCKAEVKSNELPLNKRHTNTTKLLNYNWQKIALSGLSILVLGLLLYNLGKKTNKNDDRTNNAEKKESISASESNTYLPSTDIVISNYQNGDIQTSEPTLNANSEKSNTNRFKNEIQNLTNIPVEKMPEENRRMNGNNIEINGNNNGTLIGGNVINNLKDTSK